MKVSAMKKILSNLVCGVVALALLLPHANAFSLLGPYTSWQIPAIGYNRPGDIGGPMGLREGFRWNAPLVTYAFDQSFIEYFGPDGVRAVDEAMQQYNDLASATKMSADLSEYSTAAVRQNYEAAALGLLDLKSTAMSLVLEEMGLAESVRWTWTLRALSVTGQNPPITNFTTVQRNFDPVTLAQSSYVNGTLYTFENRYFPPPLDYHDAVEIAVSGDPAETAPVASGVPLSGSFFVGLSRDDVGGLRHLYHPNNYAVETLLPDVTPGFRTASGWFPFLGTNATTTTNIVFPTGTNFIDTALRGGRNHIRFQRALYDSLLGVFFKPITNSYPDVVITNYSAVVQTVTRGIIQPDILFVAEDLGLAANLTPVLTSRSDTAPWIDNDLLNGNDETTQSRGPGLITPQVRISFSNQLPYFSTDSTSEVPGEDNAFRSSIWGSYNGSTNAPVIYPFGSTLTLQQLRQRILQPNTP